MHTIRLGPPWQAAATTGGTRHTRKFGRPRTLGPGERVWLVCAHIPGAGSVCVNGARLGSLDGPGPFAADVTERLLARNEVTVTIASDQPLGEVALEVRAS